MAVLMILSLLVFAASSISLSGIVAMPSFDIGDPIPMVDRALVASLLVLDRSFTISFVRLKLPQISVSTRSLSVWSRTNHLL